MLFRPEKQYLFIKESFSEHGTEQIINGGDNSSQAVVILKSYWDKYDVSAFSVFKDLEGQDFEELGVPNPSSGMFLDQSELVADISNVAAWSKIHLFHKVCSRTMSWVGQNIGLETVFSSNNSFEKYLKDI